MFRLTTAAADILTVDAVMNVAGASGSGPKQTWTKGVDSGQACQVTD